jgi:pSer/pThr/pTyr-binding forkhead associated (FHA) protein
VHGYSICGEYADQRIPLDSSVLTIGRGQSNQILLKEWTVSRQHARIHRIQGQFLLEDLGSQGGTLLNRHRIRASTLQPGDQITICSTVFEFHGPVDPAAGLVIESSTPVAWLYGIQGEYAGQRIPLNRSEVTIGRSQRNTLIFQTQFVSRQHAQLHYTQGRFFLQDLQSQHGTFLNGRRIRISSLQQGDQIAICGNVFEFRVATPIGTQ